MRTASTGCFLLMCASTTLLAGGCVSRPTLIGAWYLKDDERSIDILLVNRSTKDIEIHDAFLNAHKDATRLKPSVIDSVTVPPGGTMSFAPSGPARKGASQVRCLPVRIYVKTGPKQKKLQSVEIEKPLPTAYSATALLPCEWEASSTPSGNELLRADRDERQQDGGGT